MSVAVLMAARHRRKRRQRQEQEKAQARAEALEHSRHHDGVTVGDIWREEAYRNMRSKHGGHQMVSGGALVVPQDTPSGIPVISALIRMPLLIAEAFACIPVLVKALFIVAFVVLMEPRSHYLGLSHRTPPIGSAERRKPLVLGPEVVWIAVMFVLGPFVQNTSRVFCGNKKLRVARHLLRLVVSTAIWYYFCFKFIRRFGYRIKCSKFFSHHHHQHCRGTAQMGQSPIMQVEEALFSSYFGVIYSILLLAEEAQPYFAWERLKHVIDIFVGAGVGEILIEDTTEVNAAEFQELMDLRETFMVWYFVLFLSGFQFVGFWYIFIQRPYTGLIFAKFSAAAVASTCWLIIYKLWYPFRFSPGLPGYGGRLMDVDI